MPRPFLIGVTGGTASGKTTLCKEIFNSLKVVQDCILLSMDNFYKGLSDEEHEDADNYNFDHPNALDFDSMHSCIADLMERKDIEIPTYDFASHKRTPVTIPIKSSNFILFEGILALYDPRLRDRMDFKIFVTADDDTRLARRLYRDTTERGRTVEGVLKQYHMTVKPSYQQFIKPTQKYADIIVPGGPSNKTAIEFICENMRQKLIKLGLASDIEKNLSPIKREFHSAVDGEQIK